MHARSQRAWAGGGRTAQVRVWDVLGRGQRAAAGDGMTHPYIADGPAQIAYSGSLREFVSWLVRQPHESMWFKHGFSEIDL